MKHKKILLLSTITAVLLSQTLAVSAAEGGREFPDTRSVYSQENYYQYELSWEAKEGFNWDLLQEVKLEGETVASYSYDDNFNRSSKTVDGEETLFTYSDDNRILTVTNDDGIINYNYEYDEKLKVYNLSGFDYNGKRYWFDFSDGIIEGISDASGVIAKYTYGDFCEFAGTYEFVNGSFVLNEEENFIGNINELRYNASYYDKETGWYYKRRYYDPLQLRYVDGISYEDAMSEIERTGTEDIGSVLTRIYSWGDYLTPVRAQAERSARIAELSAEQEVVVRTLNAEAGTWEADWQAVAWVVYNRMNSNGFAGNTPYAIVTAEEQFTAYWEQTDEYKNPDTTTARWAACVTNAYRLQSGQEPSYRVAYIDSHVFFRSINSFIMWYASHGTSDSTYKEDFIYDIAIPGFGIINEGTSQMELSNSYAGYSGAFNIYFKYR